MIIAELNKIADLLDQMSDELCSWKQNFEEECDPESLLETDRLVLEAVKMISEIRGQ